MRTKEEIISGHYTCQCDDIYKSRGLYDPACVLHSEGGEIELIMDEFAMETAIDFRDWCATNVYNINYIMETYKTDGKRTFWEKIFDLYQQEKNS